MGHQSHAVQYEGANGNRSMKVLLIGTMYPPYVFGGAEKAIAMLTEALVRSGHDVVVLTLHPGASERTEERNGIRIYHLPLDNVYWPFAQRTKPNWLLRLAWHFHEVWNWKAAARVGRILDLEKPDVVHTHNIIGFSVAVWYAVKRRGIRLVHTLHDYYLLCPRTTLYRRGKSCENRCLDCRLLTVSRKVASQCPDEIVSVSQFVLDRHRRGGLFGNVASSVSYNIQSTNDEMLRPAAAATQPDVLHFGFIGRLAPEKGIDILLQATGHLVRPGWRLKIAGKGTEAYTSHLRSKYTDERIEWLGFASASEFYSQVDVIVIPSQWDEPLGYVCVESLHEGKPLICTTVGGLPEIAKFSKIVAYFQSGNVEELGILMNCALDDQVRWKQNIRANAVALEQFSEQAVLAGHLSAYRPEGRDHARGAGGKSRWVS
jgi:glycosyltransferase involved in cell wall biosynthesis